MNQNTEMELYFGMLDLYKRVDRNFEGIDKCFRRQHGEIVNVAKMSWIVFGFSAVSGIILAKAIKRNNIKIAKMENEISKIKRKQQIEAATKEDDLDFLK